MTEFRDVRIDVSEGVRLDPPVSMAAWLFIPPRQIRLAPRPTVWLAFPGGTYTRAYYHMQVPGRRGYSFAEHLAGAGHTVLAFDHIGLGDSTPFEPFELLTKEVVLRAMRAAVEGAIRGLAGDWSNEIGGAIRDPFLIGVGHSLGAYLLSALQRRWEPFEALVLLGYSPLRTLADIQAPAQAVASNRNSPRSHVDPAYFYAPDVPPDVIEIDSALAVRLYPWARPPGGNAIAMDPETKIAAGAIRVPIFIGLGERDMSPGPHAEPSAYPASSDLTLFVVPGAAHCFNLAGQRRLFFERVAAWGNATVSCYGAAGAGSARL